MAAESKQLISEFFGTFGLVFIGTGAIALEETYPGLLGSTGIGFAFGLAVFLMVLFFVHNSGAHINPAVSIALWKAGQFDQKRLPGYVLMQICGALLASICVRLLFMHSLNLGSTLPSGSMMQSFLLELFLSFLLMSVIFFLTTRLKVPNWLLALFLGITVGLEATFGGPISGASMNPARSIGPAIISGNLFQLWLYIVAPILGMLLAITVWKFTIHKRP